MAPMKLCKSIPMDGADHVFKIFKQTLFVCGKRKSHSWGILTIHLYLVTDDTLFPFGWQFLSAKQKINKQNTKPADSYLGDSKLDGEA